MDPAPRLSTDFPLVPGVSGAQEIVTVVTCFSTLVQGSGTVLESTAVRRFVSALDGTGLEADLGDPVTLLSTPAGAPGTLSIDEFHARALRELEARRGTDYEIADLFALEP